jgi:hypothetical protein
VQAIGTTALLAAFALGHLVQERLFGERAVRIGGYLVGAALIGAASAVAAGIGMLVFSALS